MSKFKVGDIVTFPLHGRGQVRKVTSGQFCYSVNFRYCLDHFKEDGSYWDSSDKRETTKLVKCRHQWFWRLWI